MYMCVIHVCVSEYACMIVCVNLKRTLWYWKKMEEGKNMQLSKELHREKKIIECGIAQLVGSQPPHT